MRDGDFRISVKSARPADSSTHRNTAQIPDFDDDEDDEGHHNQSPLRYGRDRRKGIRASIRLLVACLIGGAGRRAPRTAGGGARFLTVAEKTVVTMWRRARHATDGRIAGFHAIAELAIVAIDRRVPTAIRLGASISGAGIMVVAIERRSGTTPEFRIARLAAIADFMIVAE